MTDSDSRHGIIPPAAPERGRRPPSHGLKPGLTALGAAAVLGIYVAGFALTEDAAHGLDGGQRGAPRQTAQLEGLGEDVGLTAGDGASGGSGATLPVSGDSADRTGQATPAITNGPPGSPATAPGAATAATGPATAGNVSASPLPRSTTAPAAAGPGAAGAVGAASGSSSPSASPGNAAAPSPGAPAPRPVTGSTAPPSTGLPSQSATAPTPESPYLDGTYTAWGIRTGHGDIEATIEISDGRIASVVVSNCMMRWPCTDVDPLIGRILRAQRPGVPVITGATQSSDAFTTAVNEALVLARAAKTAQSPTP